ncbi:hypothetical protein OHA40_13200 [Nocardia sp. NBC_00508]|uniref:hypothetical protein n=1 Tax=Nocardia sp. NBC_00508 TaxID=2975992 RepID=UPI002E813FF5|nr:hypothetical protein [Nocardia sp. NBC_00508]WUD68986.1 hypothetical protein OHA40_13200 [Nocardia sp. NBC_00508]
MSVHVIDRVWMVSDRTPHQARRVSEDAWVVSYLRGRMLSTEQATAAIQAAEAVSLIEELANRLRLTGLEAFGLVLIEEPWDARHGYQLPRPGGRHRR